MTKFVDGGVFILDVACFNAVWYPCMAFTAGVAYNLIIWA